MDNPRVEKPIEQIPAEAEPSPEISNVEAEGEMTPAEQGAESEQKPEAAPEIKPALPSVSKPTVKFSNKDPMTAKIEKIMEDGLTDSFQNLSPVAKEEFKLRGEQAASKIRELMRSARIKVKKIFRLILDWLKMLPGINKFFLIQEAKIKTDRIVLLKKAEEI